MTQLCIRCGRTNPKGAAYCYFDGIGLHTVIEPLASPGRLDPPFYFPDGRNCKSFDELALACQSELKEAQGILLAGDFTIYFRRLSRLDLTALSERARKNLNADLALEEFLLGLP
ncbi:MAG: hypothetical protein EXR99_06195, partial [Gemmataceae bacterium]|nr:hypothetical protein [Gemmataceae bacterium]